MPISLQNVLKGEYKKDKELLYKQLKEYRLQKSKEENKKAYIIFTNSQLEDLITKYSTTEAELLSIKGFGKVKVEKYGKEILRIFTTL